MPKLMLLNRKQIKRHVFTWVIIIAYLNFDGPISGTWVAQLVIGTLTYFNYMFVFYSLSIFVFPKFWGYNKYYLTIWSAICFLLYVIIEYFNNLKITPYFGGSSYYQRHTIVFFVIRKFYFFFLVAMAGIAYFFYQYSIHKIKLHADKEKALLIKELNFLKNQFNSHITFNFLNFCYSRIHKQLPETAEAIDLFSEMLRYTLQTKQNERVSIAKEVTNMNNFIRMQKLINKDIHATFQYEGETVKTTILPHILIAFLENAFKNSECSDPLSPLLVNLNVTGNKLDFTIKSKINLNKKETLSQDEMNNVIQILNLYYSNNFELLKKEQEGFYRLKLSIGGLTQ